MTGNRMTVKTDTVVSAASYAGAGVSVIAGMTLTEWGVIIGIITALVTLAFNIVYQIRKDRRESRLADAQLRKLESGQ